MRKFYALLKYELYRWLVSPSTYVLFTIFCVSLLAIFALLLEDYTIHNQSMPFAQMFYMCFWLPTLIVVPALTMRSFSEDYKNEIIQSIFSTPISAQQVVLAKFFSAYIVFIIFWMAPLYFFAFGAQNTHIIDHSSFTMNYNIFGSSLFIAIVGMFFVSIGIFASSMSKNQLVSSMTTFFLLLVLFIGGQIFSNRTKLSNVGFLESSSGTLSIFHQLSDFCNGVFDFRIITLHISSCILILCLTCIFVKRA